jgi:TonB family protein
MKQLTVIASVLLLFSCAGTKRSADINPQKEQPQALNQSAAVPQAEEKPSAPPASDIPTVPINTVDKPPRLISGSPPSYSFEMIQNNVEGSVKALILVGRSGTVKDVSILQHLGHGTDEATRAALMKYQFEPAVKGGQTVAVWIEMSVNFRPVRR